ncbi:MAG: multiheme c-type cytochrome [Amaricoccus sp.]
MRSFLVLLSLLLAGGAIVTPGRAAQMPASQPPHYVGSAGCIACHGEEAGLWKGSDHQLAWTLPGPDTVLGDFADASFESRGVTSRFTTEGGKYFVETGDGAGGRRKYEVVGVAGIRPLQQYLLSPEPGRTQAFDIAWDTVQHRWYDLYPDQMLQPHDGLHWTGPYKSWEARCAECHATGYSRNYQPASNSYRPHAAEIGVGCEACHGPGEAHAAWAKDPDGYDPKLWPGLTPHGLTVDLAASAEVQIEQCAGCHSRREDLRDGNPLPGTPYHDSYTLSLLREGTYEADGTILAEDYELGSFLQAKMYARGVRCSDCHDPHSLELKAEGNAVCAQCHSPAGNPRFPTLRKALYDDPSHTFHAIGTPGAECKSCHMPERVYMGIDWRRDHGFRVPRPDVSMQTGGPNACTDCHKDKDAAWAAAEIAKRFPESTHRGPSFATTIAAARWDPSARVDDLVALAGTTGTAGIVRATALDMLTPVADAAVADRVAPLLADPDPLVRAAAAGAQRAVPPDARLARLAPVLGDPLASVRVEAAKAMLGADPSTGTDEARQALARATAEWQASVALRQDFPETHMQMAGAALQTRNLPAAEAAFREAVAMDPQLVAGWSMIAQIRAATGDAAGARQAVADGLAANPGQPDLTAMQGQLGP